MAITPITEDELPNRESRAVSDLKEGTGIKFPCRWNHQRNGNCSGAVTIRAATKRYGQTTRIKCKDGNLYAWRVM